MAMVLAKSAHNDRLAVPASVTRIAMLSTLLPKPKTVGKRIPQLNSLSSTEYNATRVLGNRRPTPSSHHIQIVLDNDSKNTISKLRLNADGSLNYEQTIALGANSDKNVQTSFEDTIPLKERFPNLKHFFPKPTPEEQRECIEETRIVINRLLNEKMGVLDTRMAKGEVTHVEYNTRPLVDEPARGRQLHIREFQEDPMLPPKFKLRKNRQKEPSPPPPVLKQAPAKPLLKEEQREWNIPAAISNWKNNQGFTISLDKRILAANGGSVDINPDELLNLQKFGDLSLALEDADQKAREEITIRNNRMKELALKEQQEKELKLKELAEISRRERHKRPSHSYSDNSKRRRN
jgi:SNW domain-containing protein 1